MNYPRARQLKVPLHFGGLMYHLFRSFRISYDASYHVLAIICLVQIVNSVTVRGITPPMLTGRLSLLSRLNIAGPKPG